MSSAGRPGPDEIEAVYRDQGREIWALFYAQCGHAERAQDALHESFTRLQEQNGTEIQNIRAWVLRVGRNWLRDVARHEKVAATPVAEMDHISAQHDEPITELLYGEMKAQIRVALGELTLEDREALVLRYAMGWSSARIAKTLESTASAIDMRLSRARRRLAERLSYNGTSDDNE